MSETQETINYNLLKHRFRGYLPVIIDVETAGLNAKTDALLELAAITVKMDDNGHLVPDQKCHFHIQPFEGANIDPESIKFNGIDIDNPGPSVKTLPSAKCLKWYAAHRKMPSANARLLWRIMQPLIRALLWQQHNAPTPNATHFTLFPPLIRQL